MARKGKGKGNRAAPGRKEIGGPSTSTCHGRRANGGGGQASVGNMRVLGGEGTPAVNGIETSLRSARVSGRAEGVRSVVEGTSGVHGASSHSSNLSSHGPASVSRTQIPSQYPPASQPQGAHHLPFPIPNPQPPAVA
ncbi:unnamed protein product [Arabis nemorensis]|uniref:Uncharacterized protein n=1 Tax=Arabis nemorensis TaxID=586526 RepID=A0A565CPL4_9BRAS|nr:unnamed protein product [Arabis nemorensis]